MMFEHTLFQPYVEDLKYHTQVHFEENNVPTDHGFYHAMRVARNAQCAINWQREVGLTLPIDCEVAIYCASLLHDADDRKFFSGVGYPNAIRIIQQSFPKAIFESRPFSYEEFCSLVVEMIDLVSASKNKNKDVAEKWKLIPRDSDRVEALGGMGIIRCYAYSSNSGVPIFTDETPRVKDFYDLTELLRTGKTLDQYTGHSKSCIDHFYDKVLHIGEMKSENGWLQTVADRRMAKVREFLFYFGMHGEVDQSYIEYLSTKYNIKCYYPKEEENTSMSSK